MSKEPLIVALSIYKLVAQNESDIVFQSCVHPGMSHERNVNGSACRTDLNSRLQDSKLYCNGLNCNVQRTMTLFKRTLEWWYVPMTTLPKVPPCIWASQYPSGIKQLVEGFEPQTGFGGLYLGVQLRKEGRKRTVRDYKQVHEQK